MPWTILLLVLLSGTEGNHLRMIDQLNQSVQVRFETPPNPAALGMSRILRPRSFGEHFTPQFNTTRDFEPENDGERKAIAALENESVQVGFYLFGRAIAESPAEILNYRALKGPGAMTRGTPRPAWYPALLNTPVAEADTLPDWRAIYPLAQRAMRSFADGGTGFETSLDSWHIAARPVLASQEKCLSCHHGLALNQPIGGALYAFR
jgi:hypothetical protein